MVWQLCCINTREFLEGTFLGSRDSSLETNVPLSVDLSKAFENGLISKDVVNSVQQSLF